MADPAALRMLAQVQADIAQMREDRPRLAANERTLARFDRKLAKALIDTLSFAIGVGVVVAIWAWLMR